MGCRCLSFSSPCQHVPLVPVARSSLSRTLNEIHIRVLATEHRRLTCFGPFWLFF